VPLAADQCRDARGITFVDALARDILYAFRTFRRAPLAALTIVATVALGLGMITVVFTVYNIMFLRVDAVRSPGELFEVERRTGPATEAPAFTRPEYDAMRRDTSVFTDAVAILQPIRTRIEGRLVRSALVTGNFFRMLGVGPALGRAFTPADDERLTGRPVIVLSHSGWTKLFAGDPGVIGRSVRINGLPYEIVGVMPEGVRGLGMSPPDYWAPLALAGQFRPAYAGKEDEIAIDVVVRLKPGMLPEPAAAMLTAWAAGRTDLKTERPVSIRLRPRQGTVSVDALEALVGFAPIFIAFGLILMIGCANVANLLLARGLARQRELGIRLSLGASRRRIIRQLLTESLLLAIAAAAGGLAVSRLFMGGGLYVMTNTLPPDLVEQVSLVVPAHPVDWLGSPADPIDWRVLAFLFAGAIVSTVFFGLVPALQATRFELVRTMRGDVTRDARPGRARHALIAVQVGASALLLICAVIFLRGSFVSATADPGVRTSDTVMIPITNEPRRVALLQAVTTDPSVIAVAASSRRTPAVAQASGTGAETPGLPVDEIAVSTEYFDVLDIAVVSGRGFTQAERTAEAGVAVVTQTVARRLWPNRIAEGQTVRVQASRSSGAPAPPSRAFTVVGVVRDVKNDLLDEVGVFLPTGTEQPRTSLTLRVRGDLEQARQALVERLTKVDPGLGEVVTLRTIAGLQTTLLQVAFWVTVVLGGLALVLTVSGLFSMLSYVVEQRAQEIGVRMALGATTRNVVQLVLLQSLSPVGIGLVAGGGLAAALAVVIMASSAASEIGNIVHVLDPVAYGASLLVIVASCVLATLVPALRAARIDPIATLRKD
jgi:predicted permease